MTRTLSGPSIVDDLGDRLDVLLEEVGAPITARRPWLQTWIESFTDHVPWAVVVEADDGALEAAALLARRRSAGILRIVGLGHWVSDQARLPARSPGAATELAQGLGRELGHLRGPWHMLVEQLPAGDPVATHLAASAVPGELRPGDASPRVSFTGGRDLDGYLNASLRRRVKRRRNKLRADQVDVTIDFTGSPEEIRALLPAVEQVRRSRDRALVRFSTLDALGYGAFWNSAIVGLAARGEAELATLRLDGELAAYAVSFLDGEAYRWWDHRFSPDLGRYSPGTLVNLACVERALGDSRFEEFDWMRGEEPHKLECSTDVVPSEHLEAWSSARTRRVMKAAKRARGEARRMREQHPAIGRAWLQAKSRLLPKR